MLAQGLHQYGYTLKADSLQKDLVQLPIRFGFHEYFDSFEGTGYGSDKFSWTAALFIDLVQEFYAHDETPSRIVRYIKSFVPEETVLNNGSKLPEVETDTISQALMHSIRTLRDLYYDTKRELVDYKRLKGSAEFQQYRVLTNGLKHFDLSLLTGRKEKMAFWINLYNTIVVDAIVSLGVKKSVREIPEFFRSVKYAIGPYVFSADDIEHGVLRVNVEPWFYPFKLFGRRDPRRKYTVQPIDPRIHFALVCGSRSCAPIDFYETDHIYDQLEEAARSFINSSEVIVLPEKGKLYVSEIFRWYEHDFGGIQGIVDFLYDYLSGDEARNFLRQHRTELEIDYLQYDWNLNR